MWTPHLVGAFCCNLAIDNGRRVNRPPVTMFTSLTLPQAGGNGTGCAMFSACHNNRGSVVKSKSSTSKSVTPFTVNE